MALTDGCFASAWSSWRTSRLKDSGYIHKDRSCARAHNGASSGKEGEGNGKHFIAGPNIGGHQRQFQSVRARSATDRVTGAAILGEALLEAFDLGTQDEALRFNYTRQSGLYGLAQLLILACQ